MDCAISLRGFLPDWCAVHGDTSKAWTARAKNAISSVLNQAMCARGMSAPRLADALVAFDDDVDEGRVRKWRSGATLLPLHLAQPIARILGLTDTLSDPEVVARFGYDPMVMIRLLGLVPREVDDDHLLGGIGRWDQDPDDRALIDRIRALERVELDLADAAQLLAQFEHNQAAHTVLHGVEESQEYGVAFWPVHAGPTGRPDHRLHVSDRVDLRRLDGRPTSEDQVWADLSETLARARALPSLAEPRWSYTGGELQLRDPHVSRWNLRRLDVPRQPRVPLPHPGLPALVFSATVSSTWVGNLASLVALVLGYGVTSTTDLGRHLAGNMVFNTDTAHRCRVHGELLRNPGERRVWFHAAKLHESHPNAPWTPTSGTVQSDLVHVRLCESDELLAATAEDRSHHPGFDPKDELEWRATRDRALDSAPSTGRVLILDVDHVPWGSTEKWRQTFGRVRDVLQFLEELGLDPWPGLARSQQRWVEDDPGLTRPAFRWLREAGSPFVHAPGDTGPDPTVEVPQVTRRPAGSHTPAAPPLPGRPRD